VADGGTGYRRDTDDQVVRYLPGGAVDPTFTGPVLDFGAEAPNATDLGQAITLRPNGQVVIAGYHSSNGNTTLNVARLNADGSLDSTFGSAGTVTVPLAGGGQGSVIAIQPDGKVLVVGQAFGSGTVSIVLARYLGQ